MATYQDKLNRILKSMEERTGLKNLVPGSKAYQLAESYAFEQMIKEAEQEDYTSENSIMQASDEKLDIIGEDFFKVKRLEAVKPYISSSMKALKFYVDSGLTFGQINTKESNGVYVEYDIVIPEGTIISGQKNNLTYRFRITEETVLPKNQSEAYLNAELIQGSYEQIPSGVLKIHTFSDYSQSVNNRLKVTNPVAIGTGRDSEDDDNYRYRISNSLRAFAKTSSPAIQQLVQELPGVSNAYIESAANGGGTFSVYVQGMTPITENSVIDDVNLALSDVINPWQVTYNVVKPSYIGISAHLEITVKDSASEAVSTLVGNRVTDYINNFNGRTFYINSILSLAKGISSDILDVSFGYVRVYSGSETVRSYEEIDLENTLNPSVTIDLKEKLIAEQSVTPILVTATV